MPVEIVLYERLHIGRCTQTCSGEGCQMGWARAELSLSCKWGGEEGHAGL